MVSRRGILTKDRPAGRCEPMELLSAEVPEEYVGAAVEQLGRRRGEMKDMTYRANGDVHLEFLIPTRGLIGFRTDFMTLTKGTAVINSEFAGYAPYAGEISGAR